VFSNRQSNVVSARHKGSANRPCPTHRRRFGRAGFQPRREPVGSASQTIGATRLPLGGLLAEPSARLAQPAPVRHFPVSIFSFPLFAAAFLIRYQQLEINVNHSKQSTAAISNPQKLRYLKIKEGEIPRRKKRSLGMTTETEVIAMLPSHLARLRRELLECGGSAAAFAIAPSSTIRSAPTNKCCPAEAGRYRWCGGIWRRFGFALHISVGEILRCAQNDNENRDATTLAWRSYSAKRFGVESEARSRKATAVAQYYSCCCGEMVTGDE
jgi:hypothetical protein